MKTKMLTILLIIGFVFLMTENTEAQAWKNAVNTGSNVIKKNKNKNKNKNNQNNVQDDDNQTNQQVVELDDTQNNSTQALSFDANDIMVEYGSLFEDIELNPETGELKIKTITVKNLPKANYGTNDSDHKLSAILKLKNNALFEYQYGGISEYTIGEWTDGSCNSIFKITEPGKYSIEIQIDGEAADKIDFDIIQSINKNDKSGWFINDPLGDIGVISAKQMSYGKPNPNSEIVFKFYEAILDIEGAFVDATPLSVRLMKENTTGEDTYLGGYLDEELRHNHKWKLTDNIFFSKPDNKYSYVTYAEVIASDSKYYIDLFYNGDLYRYYFEIKNGEFVSNLSDRNQAGVCWIEREYIGVPKYADFKPIGNINGKADNIRMTLRNGSTSQGYAANKPLTFSDGQMVLKSFYLSSNIKEKYQFRLTESIVTLVLGDDIIAQDITLSFNAGDFKKFLRDPDASTLAVNKETDSYLFMEALAKLPAGNHKLKLVYELASGDDNDVVGIRTITFKSDGKNPIFTKWAEDTKLYLSMTDAQLGEVSFLRSPTNDWVYFENNCGTVVWLRYDEDREYYLYSGDKGKFDRANGYIEQWNFGTWKWNPVNDFTSYKTIYMLTGNEISMLYLKQVDPQAVEKLKEIQDVEFQSQDVFIAKVIELIGESTFKKHEELIVQSASIDYVKICQ